MENTKKKSRLSVFIEDMKDKERRQIRMKIIAQALVKVCWALFRTFIIVGMSFVLIYPLLYMFSMSFRSVADMYDPSVVWIPRNDAG